MRLAEREATVASETAAAQASGALDVIFYGASIASALEHAGARSRQLIKPDGAIWIVRPKGRPEITEAETMAAGKRAGLVDVKVVSFSDTHTAEKFVIPVAKRAPTRSASRSATPKQPEGRDTAGLKPARQTVPTAHGSCESTAPPARQASSLNEAWGSGRCACGHRAAARSRRGDRTRRPRRDRARLERESDGFFSGELTSVAAGDRYWYHLDGDRNRPDPVSRLQPDGPHGPSAIVDPTSVRVDRRRLARRDADGQVLYELHVGTFTPEGTWAAAAGSTERVSPTSASP